MCPENAFLGIETSPPPRTQKLKLNKIPYDRVTAALVTECDTLKEQRIFNTCHHPLSEIEVAIPSIQHFGFDSQPWVLLSPWLSLILWSRGLKESDVHRIHLPGKILVLLKHASQVGVQLGRVSDSDAEDLADAFPNTTASGNDVDILLQRSPSFVRLDTCSPKDALIGKGPLKSAKDLWTRLATSQRATNGIRSLQEMEMPIYLYLFPWDDSLRSELEYRVYCPPNKNRIAAISQYQWHSPWWHASSDNQRGIAQSILIGCEKLHAQIAGSDAMTDSQRRLGFVFDVVENPMTQEVRLIELNEFGAMSGCGACLFQWIDDARSLYGLQEGVEFRVTV